MWAEKEMGPKEDGLNYVLSQRGPEPSEVHKKRTQKPHPSAHTHKSPIWVKPPLAGIAMATKLLFCVALCLPGVGPTDAGVTQTPRHEVTEKGQAVTLSCEPIKSHAALFWYRQTSVRGLELLIYFNNQSPIDESGMPKDRFLAKMPNTSFSTLKIQPTDPGDSATYLCASSKDTVLQSRPVPSRKPLLPLPAQPPASSAVFLGSSPSSPAVQPSREP
ncbi:hypothetical protein MJT46_006258 [Ovis ammon polii x Ovis aries]|nr:hypothetical protein MJT46_006258 [Ovis ammon polii x Ovis aries]